MTCTKKNVLKIKTTIKCVFCKEPMQREKSIIVSSDTMEAAAAEAKAETEAWKKRLKNQLCPSCIDLDNILEGRT